VVGTGLIPVVVTWIIRGPPLARLPWTISGTVLGVAATVLYFIQEEVTSHALVHGSFHLAAAFSAMCLSYGLRDPKLHEDYHLLKDLRQ